jgi:hypothetical protein
MTSWGGEREREREREREAATWMIYRQTRNTRATRVSHHQPYKEYMYCSWGTFQQELPAIIVLS